MTRGRRLALSLRSHSRIASASASTMAVPPVESHEPSDGRTSQSRDAHDHRHRHDESGRERIADATTRRGVEEVEELVEGDLRALGEGLQSGDGAHDSTVPRHRGSERTPLAYGSTVAEADGNRTRLGARAPTSVLKTVGPTRNPDASAESVASRVSEDSRHFLLAARYGCVAERNPWCRYCRPLSIPSYQSVRLRSLAWGNAGKSGRTCRWSGLNQRTHGREGLRLLPDASPRRGMEDCGGSDSEGRNQHDGYPPTGLSSTT